MKIKRINLSNFRQFYGKKNIIEFSTDNIKNVTVIHGENGVGKTTLLNSILWCFYDKFTTDFEQQEKIINNDAKAAGVKTCQVELVFIHEDKTYSATRIYDADLKKSTLSLSVIDNGNYQPIKSELRFLNSVIPEDMAEYFLFHGEGILDLQSTINRFRKAIRDILGFTLAEKAIDDLSIIKNKWNSKLNKINSEKTKFTKANENLNICKRSLTIKRSELSSLNEKYSELMTQKKYLENEIVNCKIEDASVIKKQILDLSKNRSSRENDLKREQRKRQKFISDCGWKVFGLEISENSLDFIDTSTLTGKIPAPYDETLVNDIVATARCICGREVCHGSEEYETIQALLDRANTAEIRSNILKARSFAQTVGDHAQVFIEDFTSVNKAINKYNNEIAALSDQLKRLNIQLDNIDDKKLNVLRADEKNVSAKLSNTEVSINQQNRDINILVSNQALLQREVDKNVPQDKESYSILQSIAFVQNLIDFCQLRLNETEKESKLLIAKDVNDMLNTFSRKDFSVKVTDSFSFELVSSDGDVVAKSKGERLLLNLSFVSALIKMAAQRSKASGKFLQPGTVAPFIIDAPFGELDETYRKATAQFLPNNSEQLVLLLSSSHWQGTVGKTIQEKIGSEYILISHKTSAQGSKPLDEIKIDDQVYQQSKYKDKFTGTSIMRVK